MPIKHRALNAAIIIAMGLTGYGLTLLLDGSKPPPAQTAEHLAPVIGKAAPDFTFTDINGQTHSKSDLKDRTIILNFWASWCAPCVKEFPDLLRIAQENPETVTLIALSSDLDDQTIQRFLKTQKIAPAPNIIIARDKNQHITRNLFHTFKLPETYIISPQNIITHKLTGANWTPEELLTKTLDSGNHSR